ncbi:MAG: DUF664 domain-containing protein [Marmoricola sp.]
MSTDEPRPTTAEPAELFAAYLDFYREKSIEKVAALSVEEQRSTRVPSGWTPLELLHHVAYMERRWFVWGFLGEDVGDPWGDGEGERWTMPADRDLAWVVEMLRGTGARVAGVLASTSLQTPAALGGRFTEDPPMLGWVCFHVLQEYARHVGHLDVVVELSGGPTGE